MQLMMLLFQVLSDGKRKEIFIDCVNAVSMLAVSKIVSPIHVSRVLLVFDYMIRHCFGKPSPVLLKQVRKHCLFSICVWAFQWKRIHSFHITGRVVTVSGALVVALLVVYLWVTVHKR